MLGLGSSIALVAMLAALVGCALVGLSGTGLRGHRPLPPELVSPLCSGNSPGEGWIAVTVSSLREKNTEEAGVSQKCVAAYSAVFIINIHLYCNLYG